MRISEAIDDINRDKKKEYKGTSEQGQRYMMQYDCMSERIIIVNVIRNKRVKNVLSPNFFKLDWQLVQKSVSFMEAVKSGKDFRLEHKIIRESDWGTYTDLKEALYWLEQDYTSTEIAEILTEGRFYIQEED